MAEHIALFRLSSMCRVLQVQRSGYYAWKAKPKSKRTLADESLLVKKSFEENQSIYGSPRVHCDLRKEGVLCGEKRVARLMRQEKLRSVRGYKRPRYRAPSWAVNATSALALRNYSIYSIMRSWDSSMLITISG